MQCFQLQKPQTIRAFGMAGAVKLGQMHNVNTGIFEDANEVWNLRYYRNADRRFPGQHHFHSEFIMKMARHGFVTRHHRVLVIMGKAFHLGQRVGGAIGTEQTEKVEPLLSAGRGIYPGYPPPVAH